MADHGAAQIAPVDEGTRATIEAAASETSDACDRRATAEIGPQTHHLHLRRCLVARRGRDDESGQSRR